MVDWQGRHIGIDTVYVGDDTPDESLVAGSPDLAAWETLARGAQAPLVRYGGGGLVAARSQLVAFGWTREPACGGDTIPFTCDEPPVMIWTSEDAATWQPISDVSPFKSAHISSMADGQHGLVAVGESHGAAAIWASGTGSVWQRVALPGGVFTGARLQAVTATRGGYLVGGAVSGKAAAWWSSDGRTWSRSTVEQAPGGAVLMGSVYEADGGLIAIGWSDLGQNAREVSWASKDGRAWRYIDVDYEAGPGRGWCPLGSDGRRILAVVSEDAGDGSLTAYVWESLDGVNWLKLPYSASALVPYPGDPPMVITAQGLTVMVATSDTETAVLHADALP